MVSRLRGKRRKAKREEGVVKTLMSNLVAVLERSHMHSRQPEG